MVEVVSHTVPEHEVIGTIVVTGVDEVVDPDSDEDGDVAGVDDVSVNGQ